MPIYEYRCEKCGYQFEVMQKVSDDPITKCPKCGGPVQKLISNTSFILKGTGWYKTDYASPQKNSSSSSSGGDSKTSASKSSGSG